MRESTQTVKRAIMILRLMTRRGAPGWRLSEITKASNLPHPTASRLLKCLVDEGLVVRDVATKRYRLGPLNFELGLASGLKYEFRDYIRPALERVVAETGDTAYLHLRSGLEVVCVDKLDGAVPIRASILDIGGRRPLGFGASGVAMFATMEEDEVLGALNALDREIDNNPRITRNTILKAVAAARTNGYGLVRDSTVLGVAGVGLVLPPRTGRPMLGLGVAMPSERVSAARVQDVVRILNEASAQL